MQNQRCFYIDGGWVEPTSPHDFDVINPSTETSCATISLGTQADTDRAVAAARKAFPAWANTPKSKRRELVAGLLEQYERRQEELAEAISNEMGAPIDMARNEQASCLPWHLKNYLRAFDKFEWERPLGKHALDTRILHEPIGVTALITPWNWPMNQLTLKAIAAMLSGCTSVLKPSEEAPLSSMLFAEFCHDAGIPAGVFNLVNGDGAGVGQQLSQHPDVDMVSFTGSTRAGQAIIAASAGSLKRVALELGGKGANLVFADAPEKLIRRGVRHCFHNSGQSCNAPTRMLVQKEIYDDVVNIAREVAQNTRCGPAHLPGKHLGPLVSQRQWERVQGYIQSGMDENATLIAGGLGRPEGLEVGYFVRPTVFADVSPGMRIEREEIFGPVLCIIPFSHEDEALEIANDSPYGLTHYVQSADEERCKRLARRLRAGMVEINGKGLGAGAFFGGVKASGRAREGGHWGLEEFLETKAVGGWMEPSG